MNTVYAVSRLEKRIIKRIKTLYHTKDRRNIHIRLPDPDLPSSPSGLQIIPHGPCGVSVAGLSLCNNPSLAAALGMSMLSTPPPSDQCQTLEILSNSFPFDGARARLQIIRLISPTCRSSWSGTRCDQWWCSRHKPGGRLGSH